jgi:hypothetical protein
MPALSANSAGILHDEIVLKHLAACRGNAARRLTDGLKMLPAISQCAF